METITKWAETSSKGAVAHNEYDHDKHVRSVFLSSDYAAKIRKDAEK